MVESIYLDANVLVGFLAEADKPHWADLEKRLIDALRARRVRVFTSNHVLLAVPHVCKLSVDRRGERNLFNAVVTRARATVGLFDPSKGEPDDNVAFNTFVAKFIGDWVKRIRASGGTVDMATEASTPEGRHAVSEAARVHDHMTVIVRGGRSEVVPDIEDEAMLRALARLEAETGSTITLVTDDSGARHEWRRRGGSVLDIDAATRQLRFRAQFAAA